MSPPGSRRQVDEYGTRSKSNANTDAFSVLLSHLDFPSDAESLKKLGMPVGCTITPFMHDDYTYDDDSSIDESHVSCIARCNECLAYINPFCSSSNMKWICSLCGTKNSFARTGNRYHQNNIRFLPEMKKAVSDFPCNFRCNNQESDSSKLHDPHYLRNRTSPTSMKSSERPFVHVFIIQESMPLDASQAVIEALTEAMKAMHPDMYIILMTYSSRIGVYRFNNLSDSSSSSSDSSSNSNINVGNSTTNTINTSSSSSIRINGYNNNNSSNRSSIDHTLSSLQTNTSSSSPMSVQYFHFKNPISTTNKSSQHQPYQLICPLSHTSTSHTSDIGADRHDCGINFFDATIRIGNNTDTGRSCNREAILKAITTIFDNFMDNHHHNDDINGYTTTNTTTTSNTLFPTPPAYTFSTCDQSLNSQIPTNLIVPTLEAIANWLVDISPRKHTSSSSSSLRRSNNDNNDNNSSSNTDILPSYVTNISTASKPTFNIFSRLADTITQLSINLVGGGGIDDDDDDDDDNYTSTTNNSNTNNNNNNNNNGVDIVDGDSVQQIKRSDSSSSSSSPVDKCTAIALHVFFSSSQNDGVHGSDNTIDNTSSSWATNLAKDMLTQNGVSVNLYAITSFKDQSTDLHSLAPLALLTGGEIFRCVLGVCPKDQKVRLTEKLIRAMTQRVATRCIMKLRTPTLIYVIPSSSTSATSGSGSSGDSGGTVGSLCPDKLYEYVNHMACCTTSSTVSYQLAYQKSHSGNTAESTELNGSGVALQLAFEYEMLVEDASVSAATASSSSSSSSSSVGSNSKRNSNRNSNNRETSNNNSGYSDGSTNYHYNHDDDGDVYIKSMADIFDLSEEYKHYNTCRQNKYSHSQHDDDDDDDDLLQLDIQQKHQQYFPHAYNHQHNLVVVRRIRIISFVLNCTNNMTKLIHGSDMNIITCLLTRNAFRLEYNSHDCSNSNNHNNSNSSSNSSNSNYNYKSNNRNSSHHSNSNNNNTDISSRSYLTTAVSVSDIQSSVGGGYILDWVTSMVYATTSYAYHRSRNMNNKNKNNNNNTANAYGFKSFSNWLSLVLENRDTEPLLKLSYGMLSLLQRCRVESVTDGGDFMTEIYYLILTLDAVALSKILYPELHFLNSRLLIQSLDHPFPLSHQSLTMIKVNNHTTNNDDDDRDDDDDDDDDDDECNEKVVNKTNKVKNGSISSNTKDSNDDAQQMIEKGELGRNSCFLLLDGGFELILYTCCNNGSTNIPSSSAALPSSSSSSSLLPSAIAVSTSGSCTDPLITSTNTISSATSTTSPSTPPSASASFILPVTSRALLQSSPLATLSNRVNDAKNITNMAASAASRSGVPNNSDSSNSSSSSSSDNSNSSSSSSSSSNSHSHDNNNNNNTSSNNSTNTNTTKSNNNNNNNNNNNGHDNSTNSSNNDSKNRDSNSNQKQRHQRHTLKSTHHHNQKYYKNETYLFNNIQSRLLEIPTVVPTCQFSQEGFASSIYLTDRLLEENSILLSNLTYFEYVDLIKRNVLLVASGSGLEAKK